MFEGGVFRPVGRPQLDEGQRVRITVEKVERSQAGEVLRLAAQVYRGLSANDVGEIEKDARHRELFSTRSR